MNYDQFKNKLIESLERDIADPKTIHLDMIVKNNDICLDTITILEGEANVSPSLYIDEFFQQYKKGTAFQTVYKDLLTIYQNHKFSEKLDVSKLFDYEYVKGRIMYRLINRKENQKFLEDIPYVPYLDLAIVFYVLLKEEETPNAASMMVQDTHLDKWEIDLDGIYKQARINTPALLPRTCVSMNDILNRMLQVGGEDFELPEGDVSDQMLVLSNAGNLYGASAMLYEGVLQEVAASIPANYLYVIPSSVHEVLILQADEEFSEVPWINRVIQEVNGTKVMPDSVLSDHVYLYSAVNDSVSIPE